MNVLRLSLLLAAAIASIASVFGPESDIPAPDLCSSSTQVGVDTLSILSGDGSSAGEVTDFQILPFVYGSQGGAMLPLSFELSGSGVPECVAFDLALERCSDAECLNVYPGESAVEAPALITYSQGANRITHSYYWLVPDYIFVPGSLARLTVSVGSVSKQNLIWIDSVGVFLDAGMPGTSEADAGI